MAKHHDFSGPWRSINHYTSSVKKGHHTSKYDVKLHRTGNQLVVQRVTLLQ
jgi:hypothetical protein